MLISRLRPKHVAVFLQMAGREGWICDPWEFEFLFETFPQGGHVSQVSGWPVAFVTAARYEKSGWIGNLLVDPCHRHKGLGRRMFNRALTSLEIAGTETVWLTASDDGMRLYESVGFKPADTVIRWKSRGVFPSDDTQHRHFPLESAGHPDREGWGDGRGVLLRAAAQRSSILVNSDGFLMFRSMAAGMHLGPWSCRTPDLAEALLRKAWRHDPSSGLEVFLDCPEGNRFADRLLSRAGFTACGSTVLMYRGKSPGYHPASIFALASMGSIG